MNVKWGLVENISYFYLRGGLLNFKEKEIK